MEMDIITQYCMALECAEIFARFLSGSSFVETKNKILMRYGADYDDLSRQKFDDMFLELESIYSETLKDIPSSDDIAFFFKPHYVGEIFSSIGYTMLVNFLDIRAYTVKQFMDHARVRVNKMLDEKMHLKHLVYSAMVLEPDEEGKTLRENLKMDIDKLAYDSDFKWKLYLALSEFEEYSKRLQKLLESIEPKLEKRLHRMDQVAQELARLRRDSFDDMKIEELAESMGLPEKDIKGKRVVLCMLCMPCHQLIMDEQWDINELPMFLGVAAEWGNKYHGDSFDQKLLCEAVRIVGEESKFEILHLLSKGAACGKEIASNTGLDATTVSRHLAALQKFDLIRVDYKVGRTIYYRTNKEEIQNMITLLKEVLC